MTSSPHEFLHPRTWKPALGYANGVAASGRMIFCGGLIGWNAEQEFESDDFIDQVEDIITVGEFYGMAAGGEIIFT